MTRFPQPLSALSSALWPQAVTHISRAGIPPVSTLTCLVPAAVVCGTSPALHPTPGHWTLFPVSAPAVPQPPCSPRDPWAPAHCVLSGRPDPLPAVLSIPSPSPPPALLPSPRLHPGATMSPLIPTCPWLGAGPRGPSAGAHHCDCDACPRVWPVLWPPNFPHSCPHCTAPAGPRPASSWGSPE